MSLITTLLQNEQHGGMTHQIEIDASDLTEAATNTSQSFNVTAAKEGDALIKAAYHLKTPLKDASDAAFNSNTLTVGTDGDPNAVLLARQLNENGTEILAAVTPNSLATAPLSFVADGFVTITINSMAAKSLVDIDTGRLLVQIQLAQLSEFARS